MSGTFSQFNTALSALRYSRAAMDVTSNNIANVNTEGFTRRRVESSAMGAPPVPGLWFRYDGHGEGVRVDSVNRLSDAVIQNRLRQEHSSQSWLDARVTSLSRFEEGTAEPGKYGISAMLNDYRSAWADLANKPDSTAARQTVLTRASNLADAFHLQSANITKELNGQRVLALSDVNEVNVMARDLAATNLSIITGRLDGADVSNLEDTRDLLATKLAERSGATATEQADGSVEVMLGGAKLVSGKYAGELQVKTGITAGGGTDGNPVTWQVQAAQTGTLTAISDVGGRLGAVTDLVNTTYPNYLAELGTIAKGLADTSNAQHVLGFDPSGTVGGPLFSYNAADPTSSIQVVITDPNKVAASSVAAAGRNAENAHALATLPGVDAAYQKVINGLGTTVNSAQRLADNQKVLTRQIDGAREQQAGVNIDEEMVNLTAAMRTYEAASRVMNAVDSCLDTLINRTAAH